jgi:hypothetical protein
MKLPFFIPLSYSWTASVGEWSDFLAANPEVLGPIPGVISFSEK